MDYCQVLGCASLTQRLLEIIGCSLKKLDVSGTQMKEQDVRIREGGKISGHVTVTEGSNIKLLPR